MERDLAHEGQLIFVGIGELRQPELRFGGSIHHVRLSRKTDAIVLQGRKYGMDVRNLEVDRRASLRLWTRRHDADKKAHAAAVEECHLGRSGKQEWQAED